MNRIFFQSFSLSLLILLFYATGFAQTNPLSINGRYKAGWRSVTVIRSNNSTFTARLYYPATTAAQNAVYDGSGAPYPAITFGHGFFQVVSSYQSTLEHLATHGYFVIATDSEGGLSPSHQNFANDLKQTLTYLEQQNTTSGSFLFNQVATNKFGASGHSMGGGASILATAQDTRIKALANLAAAETNPSAVSAMANVRVPVSLLSGSADTIVPVASNGQTMYNASTAPKILPIINGGWHCGFMDLQTFGCDNSTQITREQSLQASKRLLTAFFNLYLKNDETATREVWGDKRDDSLVQSTANSGIEIQPATQSPIAQVGVETVVNLVVFNRSNQPHSFQIFAEARGWALRFSPVNTATLKPNSSTNIEIRLRRVRKMANPANQLLVSARSNADNLTRAYGLVNLR